MICHEKVFDKQAAQYLEDNNIAHPTCAICGVLLAVTKKFRTPVDSPRCKLHFNTHHVLPLDVVQAANPRFTIISNTATVVLSTKLTLSCPDHGEFTQTAKYFMGGGGCQKCYSDNRAQRVSESKWLEKARAAHNEAYTYSGFTSTSDNVTVTCPVHGQFVQNAGTHARGHGCRQCASTNNALIATLTTQEFIDRANATHNQTAPVKYTYENTVYTGAREKVKINCVAHGEFEQVAYYHLAGNGCAECGRQLATFKSAAEYEIIDFLHSFGVQTEHSWRGLGFEVDIFLPQHNIGIEYNGVYWHSSGNKKTDAQMSKQHLIKTTECEKNNIQLLHILDLEWNDPSKQQIWKSMLLAKLKLLPSRVYARNCTSKILTSAVSRKFLDDNHMQGFAKAKTHHGLFHRGILVAVGSFGQARFSGQDEFEIIRFASLINVSVVGGFSKILATFNATANPTGKKIISYANRRWSMGEVYQNCGFTLVSVTAPCYNYTDNKRMWHRSVFQKHKLGALLGSFDPALSEVDNMYLAKYRRIWDCGNNKYKIG